MHGLLLGNVRGVGLVGVGGLGVETVVEGAYETLYGAEEHRLLLFLFTNHTSETHHIEHTRKQQRIFNYPKQCTASAVEPTDMDGAGYFGEHGCHHAQSDWHPNPQNEEGQHTGHNG